MTNDRKSLKRKIQSPKNPFSNFESQKILGQLLVIITPFLFILPDVGEDLAVDMELRFSVHQI